MRVRSIHLKNFKRFTDLLIRDIPETARLVVVVGSNGCGKSSLFDAFLHWYRVKGQFDYLQDESYFLKNPTVLGGHVKNQWLSHVTVEVELHGNAKPDRNSFYVRTSYRNDPDVNVAAINRRPKPSENVRIQRLIDYDRVVAENYNRLVEQTISGVYETGNDAKTVEELRGELIGQIRTSMKRVFGDLVLNDITDPFGTGTFMFEKGTSKAYHYKNLSGGEKAAFDLILDLHIKKKYFPEAIYCIDEVETHLHTKVQGALVRELVDILPEKAQLWVATHSLGVLRAAQELEKESPGAVCVIDFDGVNLDEETEITPSALGRIAWEKMLSIAIDDLSTRVAPEVIVVCEGSSQGKHRKDFDAEIYNRIFGPHVPGILFISGGSSEEVAKNAISTRDVLRQILPSTKVVALADRDDRSDEEVREWEQAGNLVLRERNLESYLFADDVIENLVRSNGKPEKLNEALQIKQQAIEASMNSGKARDDLKAAAGRIYVGLKKLLNLSHPGNRKDAFMRDTLAPLIKPEMDTYKNLKAAIIDRIVGGGA